MFFEFEVNRRVRGKWNKLVVSKLAKTAYLFYKCKPLLFK